ncbi:histone deacetylase family protein [Gimibacter soli]|uniref:Histone deacetylase family protein n=1 Tax=Gimibacter soli TaxID=3024400 RepID=A0AAE9XTT6_9PROT|nr:histone deacetylase family protein [Gimibacter soli]WCL53268.1 histone deacetylase family protein [Gimibacter soli]
MLIFHSDAANLHDPEHFFRMGKPINHPENAGRYRLLYDAVAGGPHELRQAGDLGREPITRVHDAGYVEFLATAWERGKAEGLTGDEINTTQFSVLPPLQRPTTVQGQMGLYASDTSVGIRAGTWDAVYGAAQTALSGAEAVLAGERAAYALCRPPGHHASAARGSGFCFLNNAAIATEHLRGRYEGVAVLDIDVHHGDGTQRIFYERGDVLTVSVHASTQGYFPHYTGGADETGAGDGAGYNLNIPLAHQSGDAEYLAAIATGLKRIAAFEPGALVVSLGLDAAAEDPVGVLNVTGEGFAKAARMIAAAGLPTLLVQEGGYPSEALPRNLVSFLAGFEDA